MEKKSNALPRSGAGYMRRRHRPIWESRRAHNSGTPPDIVPVAPIQRAARGMVNQPTRPAMDQGGGEAVPFRPHPQVLPQPPVLPRPPLLRPTVLSGPSDIPCRPVLPHPLVAIHPSVLPRLPIIPHPPTLPYQLSVIPSTANHRPLLPPVDTTYIGDNSGQNTDPSTRNNSPLSTSSGDFEAHVAHQLRKTIRSDITRESGTLSRSGHPASSQGRTNLDDVLSNDEESLLTARLKTQTEYLVFLKEERLRNTQHIQHMNQYLQSLQQEAAKCHQRRLILGAKAAKVSEQLALLRNLRTKNEVRFKLMVSNNKMVRKLCQKLEEEIQKPRIHSPCTRVKTTSVDDDAANTTKYKKRVIDRVTDNGIVNQKHSEDTSGKNEEGRPMHDLVCVKHSPTSLGKVINERGLQSNNQSRISVYMSTSTATDQQMPSNLKSISNDVIRVNTTMETNVKRQSRSSASESRLKGPKDSHNQSESSLQDRDTLSDGRVQVSEAVISHNQSGRRSEQAPDEHKASLSSPPITTPDNRSRTLFSSKSMFVESENSIGCVIPPKNGQFSQSHRKNK